MACGSTEPSPACLLETLARRNHLPVDDFYRFHLRPGMAFAETRAWWRSGPRTSPHEGLDLRDYLTVQGEVKPLPVDALAPVALSGVVAGVFDDFLGRSVLVVHELFRDDGARLVSISAHLTPSPKIKLGRRLEAGEPIGRLAPAQAGSPPPHLHLSTLWLTGDLPADLNWPAITASDRLSLCDPLQLPQICDQHHLPIMPGNWQVYMLSCRDGSLYTGITTDLGRRTTAHNTGKTGARYTRARRPVRLVFSEPAASRAAASRREWRIKRLPPGQKRALWQTTEGQDG